jgi:hypothetical protein
LSATAGRDDTFPKLLARNAQTRRTGRRSGTRISASGRAGPGRRSTRSCAPSRSDCPTSESPAGRRSRSSGRTAPALLDHRGGAMARGRAGPDLRRLGRGRDGLRARPRGGDARGGRGPGTGRQAPVRRRAALAHRAILYDEPRGLRSYDDPRLASIESVIGGGERRLAAGGSVPRLLDEALAGTGARTSPSSSTPRAPRAAPRA